MKTKFKTLLIFVLGGISILQAQTYIVSHYPGRNALNVDRGTNITVTFSQGVDERSLSNETIRIFGSQTGLHRGRVSYDSSTQTVTINPDRDFNFGEVVTVELTGRIRFSNGDSIRPYIWSFTTGVSRGTASFFEKARIGVGSYPVGISLGDIDGDGDIDIAVDKLWFKQCIGITQ